MVEHFKYTVYIKSHKQSGDGLIPKDNLSWIDKPYEDECWHYGITNTVLLSESNGKEKGRTV